MMGGSRGDPSPTVAALATLVEIADILRNADKILPAGVTELRAAEKAARTAWSDVEKATAQQVAREKALDERNAALGEREKQTAARETACAAREQETARRETTFAEQSNALDARKHELDRRDSLLTADKAEFDATKLLHAGNMETQGRALVEEIDRQHRSTETAVQAIRDDAAADIREWRAQAHAEIEEQRKQLQQAQAQLMAREEQLRDERARLSAILQQE